MVFHQNIQGRLLKMPKINKKIALKLIAKLPITKEQKDEIRKGVLQELEPLSKMNSEELQAYLDKLNQK